jgi:hypothetical protein
MKRTTASLLVAIAIVAIAAIILAAVSSSAPAPVPGSSSSSSPPSTSPPPSSAGAAAANDNNNNNKTQAAIPSSSSPSAAKDAAAPAAGEELLLLPSFAPAAKNLTENPEDSVYGQVASSGDNVFVVWQESVDDAENSNYDIYFKRSQDGGTTFPGDAINLSRNPGFSEHPQIAISEIGKKDNSNNNSNGNNNGTTATATAVYVSWVDDTSSSDREQVLFRKSVDGGATFEEGGPAKVLSDPGTSSFNHEMAAYGNSVYVVWQQEEDDGSETIILRASRDEGNTFDDPVVIAGAGSDSNSGGGGNSIDVVDPESFPKVAAYGNDIHVVWTVAGGSSSSSNDAGGAQGDHRQQQSPLGLYYARSSDGGKTFSHAVKLVSSSGDGGGSGAGNRNMQVGETQVAAYRNDVHIVWGGLNSLVADGLYYTKSTDRGDTFSDPRLIGLASEKPSNVELALMTLTPAAMNVSSSSSAAPDKEREGGGGQNTTTGDVPRYSVHIASQAAAASHEGNEEILLLSSPDGGSTFAKEAVVNLSRNAGVSECPSISISGNNIFVTWEDLTTGNHEILFAKGSLSSAPLPAAEPAIKK